ncbi:hypothetical protein WICPIJ_008236 [Wickerhamomyces pijperi]|uniref:Uncharacterized protein n=1 Tax=Wickerhamomyces pijperi TaxID=599730 RepID=A0A9P8PZP7_WICPI|nr:hypothetical protein WICPIJ_008236 [Wickerhamomyces pijperi]
MDSLASIVNVDESSVRIKANLTIVVKFDCLSLWIKYLITVRNSDLTRFGRDSLSCDSSQSIHLRILPLQNSEI